MVCNALNANSNSQPILTDPSHCLVNFPGTAFHGFVVDQRGHLTNLTIPLPTDTSHPQYPNLLWQHQIAQQRNNDYLNDMFLVPPGSRSSFGSLTT